VADRKPRLGPALGAALALALSGLALLGGGSYYYGGRGGDGCASCHEIRPMVDAWAASTHRGLDCAHCHGSSFAPDAGTHAKNLSRLWLHARGEAPEQVRLGQADVVTVSERCGRCHRQEEADWRVGPHGGTFGAIFLDPGHNAKQALMDDCLRCHGMHFDGGIRDLVTPLDRKGPWRFVQAEHAELPAVPCLACHSIHRKGEPLGPRPPPTRTVDASGPPSPRVNPARTPRDEAPRPSLGFFDRRALQHVGLASLPLPAMREGARAVRQSPDRRQALCYQCHASRAESEVFSGDDRTPTGVHEGLSCFACHDTHAQTTGASCAGCHPRLSNCGLDVETMDTSFRSPDSRHDVHRVACRDCHPAGVPRKALLASP
jgi:hypothetical protein